jgi:hypothetical protein
MGPGGKIGCVQARLSTGLLRQSAAELNEIRRDVLSHVRLRRELP